MAIPETVLSNPIIVARLKEFITCYNNAITGKSAQASSLLNHQPHPCSLTFPHSSHNPLLWRMSIKTSKGRERLGLARDVVLNVACHLLKGLQEHVTRDIHASLGKAFPSDNTTAWSDNTYKWNDRAMFWADLVKQQVKLDKKGPISWTTSKRAYINRYYVVLPTVEAGHLALTSDQVLMFKDITHSYLSASIHLDLVGPQCHLLQEDLLFMESWSTQILEALGNDAYDIIKGLESACKGRLIEMSETILNKHEVYNEKMGKIRRKEEEYTGSPSCFVPMLDRHLQSISDLDRVSELFCLVKMAGHPQVDPAEGGRKAREKGTNHPFIAKSDCLGIERSFCHVYTRGYIKRHGDWPPMQFLRKADEEKSVLERLRDDNFQNLPLGLSMYPASDWDSCIFLPHKAFDMGSDVLALIKDKSLSLLRTEYYSAWNKDLPFPVQKPSTSRRVLIELLKSEDFNLEDIVRMVQHRTIPHCWLIVSITPKEREMKKAARMFAMMVLPMRTFFVALEHNLAVHIFPEIEEQTMTLSKIEVVKRFFGLSNPGDITTKVHIEIDFESWNLAWEEKSVAPIGARQDQIFGEPGTYTFVHEFFKNSLINVRVDGVVPPGLTKENMDSPPESDLLWYNHIGGFEGISQKLWTSATIGMIHWALWDLGIDYALSGQADNQVITLTVRYPNDIRDENKTGFIRTLVRKVKRQLATRCQKLGQIIKEEECIQSTSYLSYSKDMWVNGRCLSTSMKSITRMFPTTSDDTPSLYEMVSGLTSGGLSVSEKCVETGSSYWLTLTLIALLLNDELTNSMLHGSKLGNELEYTSLSVKGKSTVLTLLSVLPLDVGGLPTPSWIEFMHRGVPDPLSSAMMWLDVLKSLWTVNAWGKILLKKNSPWISLSPNLDMLVLDPFSLPLNRPANPKLKAANSVRDELIGVTRNREILTMLSAGSPTERTNLLRWLTSIQPCFPKVLHDIYNASSSGVVEKFSKRFTTTRTLLSLGRMSGVDVQGIAIRSDLKFLTWVLHAAKASLVHQKNQLLDYPWFPGKCYQQVLTLRNAWGGIGVSGVTTAHSLDLGIYSSEPILQRFPPNVVVACVYSKGTSPLYRRGPVAPYLGSSTEQKTAYKGSKPVDPSPPVKDALLILGIRNWVAQPGSNFWDDLTHLAQSRVNFDVVELEPFVDPIIGGTIYHRYSMIGAEAGAYISCHPNISSNIVLSSNKIGELGEKDYPVMIQCIYLTLIALISLSWGGYPEPLTGGLNMCYLIPDVSNLIEIHDSPIADQVSRLTQVIIKNPCSYLVGSNLQIPGRSLRSAKFSTCSMSFLPDLGTDLPLAELIRFHLRQRLRRIPTPIRHGGRSWAEELPTKLIDMPEITHISDVVFLTALVSSIMDSIRLGRGYLESKEDWLVRYTRIVQDRLLALSPAILSTWNSCLPTQEYSSYRPLTQTGGCVRLTTLGVALVPLIGKGYFTPIFIKEPEAIGTSVRVLFNRLITTLNLIDSKESLRSAKVLNDILKKTTILAVDEWDLQRRLWIALSRLPDVRNFTGTTPMLPAVGIRALRTEIVDLATIHVEGLPDHLLDPRQFIKHPCGRCHPSGVRLVLPSREVFLSGIDVSKGWEKRLLGYLGSGYYNWYPIPFVTMPDTTYHIVGAGDATLDRNLPPTCTRIYYDTRASTLRRGQGLVDPPSKCTGIKSSLSPLSWSTDFDIRSDASLDRMITGIRDRDTVIIDVDRVSLVERVYARDYISRSLPGVMVLVRITGSQQEIDTILSSVCACASKSTLWWRSPIHPTLEAVIGNSSGVDICPVTSLEGTKECGLELPPFPFPITETELEREMRYHTLNLNLIDERLSLARREPTRQEERDKQMANLILSLY
jgi:hypothetical protein